MYTVERPIASVGGAYMDSIASGSENSRVAESYRIVTRVSATPDAEPQIVLAQLLAQIRGVLISLLSYELQTPLSTIQTTVETLVEGDTIPAQAQRQMIQLALSELERLCLLVESFLAYANQIWALTLDLSQLRSGQATTAYLKSMFAALPDAFERPQSWMEMTIARLTPFLQSVSVSSRQQTSLALPHERALLEQEWRQILAIVNHELRTPFTTLKVCLETMACEEEAPAAARQALLDVASDDLTRLSALGDCYLASRPSRFAFAPSE